MHYYKRNIGDYAKKAGRLSMLQHGAYTLLIDSCYDRERFPTLEEAIDWTWASSTAEIEAVEFVLRRFFDVEDGVYVQRRIQEDLIDYQSKAETNKRIAIEREAKRKGINTKRERVVHEAPPNHKPLTTNHKPLTKEKEKDNTCVASSTAPPEIHEIESPKSTPVEKPSTAKPKTKRFVKPTPEEITEYFAERGITKGAEAAKFFDYYESNGWRTGRNPMKDWKAAVRNWVRNMQSFTATAGQPAKTKSSFEAL